MNWMLLLAAFIVGVLAGGVASFFACAATIRLERDRRTFAEGFAKKISESCRAVLSDAWVRKVMREFRRRVGEDSREGEV